MRSVSCECLPGLLVLAVLAWGSAVAAQPPDRRPQVVFDRAVADFQGGRIAEAVAGFDRLVTLVPDYAPHLWQRGIALYYAGRYGDCRAQFEAHRTVNPNDVENAAWHFVCVARGSSVDEARDTLLPVGPDRRIPMREVYEMFSGRRTPDEVLAAAGRAPVAQFYAHLYIGLYFEALADDDLALAHIRQAAAERFADAGGYMHAVARVHLGILQRAR